jgi:hypothetical protein
MIDHGAALYMHHRWAGWEQKIQSPFPMISDHVLLAFAGEIDAADARLRPKLSEERIRDVVAAIPEDWLSDEPEFRDTTAQRQAYVRYLWDRLNGPRAWLQAAVEARRNGPAKLSVRQTHRVV